MNSDDDDDDGEYEYAKPEHFSQQAPCPGVRSECRRRTGLFLGVSV